ncbi:hypothetical protein E2C01_025802 [Portunus trituberculatus]|uniref:Uncharacterized protein n=1 Tax=Portunus trituberculatus TaxID=210409 RepID=A0A5B7EE87_PORTR|nr:hypothetical protein [Portunus trituberculatus]
MLEERVADGRGHTSTCGVDGDEKYARFNCVAVKSQVVACHGGKAEDGLPASRSKYTARLPLQHLVVVAVVVVMMVVVVMVMVMVMVVVVVVVRGRP